MLHSSLSSHNLMMIILISQLVSFNVITIKITATSLPIFGLVYALEHPADYNQYFLVKFFADFVDKLI